MDRREALKKLGVGTAIVVSGPAVLPSFRVAAAASGGIGQTGLIDVPLSGDPIPWVQVVDPANAYREIRIQIDVSAVTCVDGSQPEFSANWRIVSANFSSKGGYKRLSVNTVRTDANVPFHESYPSGVEIASMPAVKHSFSGGTFGPTTYSTDFMVRNRYKSGEKKEDDGAIDSGTSYVLEARCRWHCPGAPEDVVANYQFAGTALDTPSTTNTYWDDQAPA